MEHTALLIIDVQHAMVMENPYAKDEVIANIKKLIEACRENKIEVVYVRHSEVGSELDPGSEGWQIYADVCPIEGERVFEKVFNSAFKRTGLREYLDGKRITQLIVTGMQTEYCIDTSIKVAFEFGYKLIIPEKTNTTFDSKYLSARELYEHYNYNIFKNRFGVVESVEDTLARTNSNR